MGTATGFDTKRLWPAPLTYFSASLEGFPVVDRCSGSFSPLIRPIFVYAGELSGGGLYQGGEWTIEVDGGCSTLSGEDSEVHVMMLDVDGDGRPDLVDAHGDDGSGGLIRRWWRNEGDGFSPVERYDLMELLVEHSLARHRTEQTVIVRPSTEWDASVPVAAQTATNFGLRQQSVYVGDLNGDGLLDSIRIGVPGVQDRMRMSRGTRPGLLTRVVRGAGAETWIGYESSSKMWPSGSLDVAEHSMNAHRPVVLAVTLEDPVTDQWYRRTYSYGEGYCEVGACWGFAWREVEHDRHDPELHSNSQGYTLAASS